MSSCEKVNVPVIKQAGGKMLLSFTNSKGGVGKSTLAVHLAAWLTEKGKRVALVDVDVLGSSSAWIKEASPQTALYRILTPDDVLEQLPNIQDEFEHVVVDGPGGLSRSEEHTAA